MNTILSNIIKSKGGHYVHVLEVYSRYELEAILEMLYHEFAQQYTTEQIVEFFETLSVYGMGDDAENEKIYGLDLEEFILELAQ